MWFAFTCGGMKLSAFLAGFLLAVEWVRLASAQSPSVTMLQPEDNSESLPLPGTTANELSLSVLPSSLQDQQQTSYTAVPEMASMAPNDSSSALGPTSSSNLPIAAVSSVSTSSSTQGPLSPSPSASAVPPASILTGSITSDNLTEEFVGM